MQINIKNVTLAYPAKTIKALIPNQRGNFFSPRNWDFFYKKFISLTTLTKTIYYFIMDEVIWLIIVAPETSEKVYAKLIEQMKAERSAFFARKLKEIALENPAVYTLIKEVGNDSSDSHSTEVLGIFMYSIFQEECAIRQQAKLG